MPIIRSHPEVIDLLDVQQYQAARYPFLLQSVLHGSEQARFDILFAFPGEILQLDLNDPEASDFLTQLDAHWQASTITDDENIDIPFRGGWFLYLAYELAAQIEPSLRLPIGDQSTPKTCAVRIPAAIIVDHVKQQTVLVAESGQDHLLAVMECDLRKAASEQRVAPSTDTIFDIEMQEPPADDFLKGIEQIHHYIREGDIFQVNLSRLWQGTANNAVAPQNLYRRLRESNPAGFAGLALLEQAAIISSSPERLVQSRQRHVSTRPIAGTHPRTAIHDDHSVRQALLSHPKERAEHIMLIDLERNDLGRVCIPGTVEVDELMVLESYAFVHHIVSNVSGQLRTDITPGELIRAVFPGGTITGCPKVRCMEIIAELEKQPRGAYTGSMGYLNHNGNLDLNILIRTLVQQDRQLCFRAGAGIVMDSNPHHELDETRAKAEGLLHALNKN